MSNLAVSVYYKVFENILIGYMNIVYNHLIHKMFSYPKSIISFNKIIYTYKYIYVILHRNIFVKSGRKAIHIRKILLPQTRYNAHVP